MPKLSNSVTSQLPSGRLQTPDGDSVVFHGRCLGMDDLAAVYALHRQVLAALPAGRVAHETLAFFADHVARRGRLLGLCVDSELVAYAVLGLPGPQDENFGHDQGMSAAELPLVAHLDGASVAPGYRGHHLQRVLVHWRQAVARAAGRRWLLSTVSPENPASLVNLFACGLQICGLAEKYGGWRYLLRSDLQADRQRSLRPAQDGQWLPVSAIPAQAALLAEGQRGWDCRNAPSGLVVYFAPAEAPAGAWPDDQPISRQ